MAYNQDMTSWTPTNPFQGPQAFDTSVLQYGLGQMRDLPQYAPTRSPSFTFNNPAYGSVASRGIVGGPSVTGRRASAGPYGTSSAGDVRNAYMTGFGAASSPIMSQGAERMRMLGQGFGGENMSGGARRALVLKNAQKTGEDLANLSGNLGSGIAQRMLGQQETARQADYGERQNIEQDYQNQLRERDTGAYAERTQRETEDRATRQRGADLQFQAEQDRQQRQAEYDYRNAGFSDEQARFAAQQNLMRAMQMTNYGFQLPQMQASLYNSMLGGWDAMQGLGEPFRGTAGA